jgi:hypothetical protein
MTKTLLSAVALAAMAGAIVAFQPAPADAMPRIDQGARIVQAELVEQIAVKPKVKRRIKRFIRRHTWHPHAHRHGYGRFGYGGYYGCPRRIVGYRTVATPGGPVSRPVVRRVCGPFAYY